MISLLLEKATINDIIEPATAPGFSSCGKCLLVWSCSTANYKILKRTFPGRQAGSSSLANCREIIFIQADGVLMFTFSFIKLGDVFFESSCFGILERECE